MAAAAYDRDLDVDAGNLIFLYLQALQNRNDPESMDEVNKLLPISQRLKKHIIEDLQLGIKQRKNELRDLEQERNSFMAEANANDQYYQENVNTFESDLQEKRDDIERQLSAIQFFNAQKPVGGGRRSRRRKSRRKANRSRFR
jgi:hypothetical protein